MCETRHWVLWVSHRLVICPWKNARTLCCEHWVCLNMKHLNGCSWPCPMHEVVPLHLGVMPNNQVLGKPFPMFFQSPSFVHSQLYSTTLKLSSLPLLYSIRCSRQFSVLVLFQCLWVCMFRLLGGGIVHLRHTSWVQASTDNVEYITLYACISAAVSWCILAWKCPTFLHHNSIWVWFHNIGYRSTLLWVCIFLSSIVLNDPHVPFQHILYRNRWRRGRRLSVWSYVSTTLACLHIHKIHAAAVVF